MKFKGVLENSRIFAIGSLSRAQGRSDWKIAVTLDPEQTKKSFGVSHIPILARRRVLNATKQPHSAGYKSKVIIDDTRNWRIEPIDKCPIPRVSEQEDKRQLCFVFKHQSKHYYLPQLELARVLFFHHGYLARLSLIPNSLSQEFDLQGVSEQGEATVNIMPTCNLPDYVRGDHALRRLLAWILLDDDARRSFDSIAQLQIKNGYDKNNYRVWSFQFQPPRLVGVELALRGHFDKSRNAYFVYEIDSIAKLKCDCPKRVVFFDPRFADKRSAGGVGPKSKYSSEPIADIDDENTPASDHLELKIDVPAVAFEFINPIQTTRSGKKRRSVGGNSQEGAHSDLPKDTDGLDVSVDEASIYGTRAAADYDGLDDKSLDTPLYTGKFETFEAMLDELIREFGYQNVHREIRKLPRIKGYSKSLLADGNPRCLYFQLISQGSSVYALIEVDTSDGRNQLSTLLIKQRGVGSDWNERISEIARKLVKGSLTWPKSYLDEKFKLTYKRISHQRLASDGGTDLDLQLIKCWARRVKSAIDSVELQK
ncbi:MAG: Tn7-like element transposition protein TnsE [Polaribacter sp.]|uniref:Tn7-like element transposition protein TnsE n=1 Tax=Polaribacter sp. TaxID=1920175 RepID=UPI003BB1EA33